MTTLTPDPNAVVTKAVLSAAESLGLSREELAKTLEIPTSMDLTDEILEEPESIDRALLLIQVYKSLLGLTGDTDSALLWMTNSNRELGGNPLDVIQTSYGLKRIWSYLNYFERT